MLATLLLVQKSEDPLEQENHVRIVNSDLINRRECVGKREIKFAEKEAWQRNAPVALSSFMAELVCQVISALLN